MDVLTPMEFVTLLVWMGFLLGLLVRYTVGAWDVPNMLYDYTQSDKR